MTRMEKLAEKIQAIYEANKAEIEDLPTTGPSGGTNAMFIDGWDNPCNGTITRAANMSDMPVLNLWTGSNPTPSSAIPTCVVNDCWIAYNDVFGK